MKTYLLSLGSIIDDVSHNEWQQFSYVVYTSGESAISSRRTRGLSSFARMF